MDARFRSLKAWNIHCILKYNVHTQYIVQYNGIREPA